MRFERTLAWYIGLTVMLLSGEPWLRHGLAAPKSKIAFTHLGFDNYEIYVMDADGGNRENLSNHPVDDKEPDWSPDGTKIAFISNRNGGVYQVYVMDADGSNQVRLTDGPWEKREPDWSPDGGKIAFTVYAALAHIDVMDADGANRRRFEDEASDPSWSPDGGEMAFVSWRENHFGIYVIGADGQRAQRVARGDGHGPTFSPDGRRIAFYESDIGIRHIYVMDTDGKNRRKLTRNQGHHSRPTWSPDGEAIAYMVSKNLGFADAQIHLMTADGKHLKRLSKGQAGIDFDPDFNRVPLAVSPASNEVTIWGRLKKLAPHRR